MNRIVAATVLGAALLAATVLVEALRPEGVPRPGETPSAAAAEIAPSAIRVLDGDTIRVNGARPDYRLVGFNVPETRRAQCEAEAQLGAKATARLREIVRAGGLTLERVPCACPAGTEGTDRCNFGRYGGTLRSRGRDVGDVLIGEGLAVPSRCSGTRSPTMPRPWCDEVMR